MATRLARLQTGIRALPHGTWAQFRLMSSLTTLSCAPHGIDPAMVYQNLVNSDPLSGLASLESHLNLNHLYRKHYTRIQRHGHNPDFGDGILR